MCKMTTDGYELCEDAKRVAAALETLTNAGKRRPVFIGIDHSYNTTDKPKPDSKEVSFGPRTTSPNGRPGVLDVSKTRYNHENHQKTGAEREIERLALLTDNLRADRDHLREVNAERMGTIRGLHVDIDGFRALADDLRAQRNHIRVELDSLRAVFNERDSQFARLAVFIASNVPGEPSQNQGMIDTAIRIIRQLQAENSHLRVMNEATREGVEQYRSELAEAKTAVIVLSKLISE